MQTEVATREVQEKRGVGEVARAAGGKWCRATVVQGLAKVVCAVIVIHDAVVKRASVRSASAAS